MKNLFVFFVAFLSTTLTAGDIVIAENGHAKADIVIPAEPSAYVKFAATELKQYLDKITGGDFKITSQPTTAVKIRLGQSAESKAAGLKPETLKEDGFFISVKGNNIFIVGMDNSSVKNTNLFNLFYYESQRGTIIGVYEFLEQLGVRWPAPGPDHEFIPKTSVLKVSEGTQKIEPFFQDRRVPGFWEFYASFPDAKEYCDKDSIYLWGLRLKLSGRNKLIGAHSQGILKLKEIWGDHQERFALINGKRNLDYLCWTNPDVIEMWKSAADAYFSGKKPAEIGFIHLKPYIDSLSSWPFPYISQNEFMIDPADNTWTCDGRCLCQRCNEFREKYPCSDDSELLWKVFVEVAESIKEKHPGKFITTLVYPPKWKVPKYVKIPENVRVRICINGPINLPTPKRMEKELSLVKEWMGILYGVKPFLWTYQCDAAFGRKLPGMPETYPHLIAEFIKIYRNNIAGMYLEQIALTHTSRNLDAYITARLLWDPDRNVDNELAEYFRVYYGPAGESAQKLFKRFEDNWIKYWKLATPDKAEIKLLEVCSPAKELQKLIWTKIYNQEEMKNIDFMITDIEKSTADNPIYSKRARLIRTWIFDVMKAERAEVMEKTETRQVAKVPIIKAEPMEIDWASIPIYRLISATRLKPQLTASGQFKLLRFGDILFMRAELKESKLTDSLTKKDRKPRDTDVWQDNDVEIFIYSKDSKDLWQIIVNDQGNWASQKINTGKTKWVQMERLQIKVSYSNDGWIVDASIPLEQFGSEELYFNLIRSRKIKDQPNELSTWSFFSKVGSWHDPDTYGTLLFDDNFTGTGSR